MPPRAGDGTWAPAHLHGTRRVHDACQHKTTTTTEKTTNNILQKKKNKKTTPTTSNRTSTYTVGPPETVAQVATKNFSSIGTSGNYAFRVATSTGSSGTGMRVGLAANANISGAGNVISGVQGRYFCYIETTSGYLDYYSTVYMRSPTVNLVAGDRIYVAAQLPTSSTTNSADDCLWIGVT